MEESNKRYTERCKDFAPAPGSISVPFYYSLNLGSTNEQFFHVRKCIEMVDDEFENEVIISDVVRTQVDDHKQKKKTDWKIDSIMVMDFRDMKKYMTLFSDEIGSFRDKVIINGNEDHTLAPEVQFGQFITKYEIIDHTHFRVFHKFEKSDLVEGKELWIYYYIF